jgi:hypothetical protein
VLDRHKGDVYLDEPAKVGGYNIYYDGKSTKGNAALMTVSRDGETIVGNEHVETGVEKTIWLEGGEKISMKVLSIADTVVRTDITLKGPAAAKRAEGTDSGVMTVEASKGAHAIVAAMMDKGMVMLDYGAGVGTDNDTDAKQGVTTAPTFESQFFDSNGRYIGTYRTSEGKLIRGGDVDVQNSPGFDVPDYDPGLDSGCMDAGPDSGVDCDVSSDSGSNVEVDTDSESDSDVDTDSDIDCGIDGGCDTDTDTDIDSDCDPAYEHDVREFERTMSVGELIMLAGCEFVLEDSAVEGEVRITATMADEVIFVERSFDVGRVESIEHAGVTITVEPLVATKSDAYIRITMEF